MIPLNIILCLYGFIALYLLGLGLSVWSLIVSLKEQKRGAVFASFVILMIYVLYGLALI
jgi:hypothetical protein